MEQESDPKVLPADVNDATMTWGTARLIWNRHPGLRSVVEAKTAECVELAKTELGLFGGCNNLCREVGLDPAIGQDYMMSLFGQTIPELVA